MAYSSKEINDMIDYSKMLVDSICGDCPEDLRKIQYLIFAGMVCYYGKEHIGEIYNAFYKTNFVRVREPSIDICSLMDSGFIERTSVVSPDYLNDFCVSSSPACMVDKVEIDANDSIAGVTHDIYVSDDRNIGPYELVDAVLFELNRVVNSVNNSFSVGEDGDLMIRTGLSFRNVCTGRTNSRVFEDAVNTLQSEEIMKHILGFASYEIKDSVIREAIDIVNEEADKKKEQTLITLLVRPIYETAFFKEVLKIGRLGGEINFINGEFNSKAGDGSFEELINVSEAIGDFDKGSTATYGVVRQYTKDK